MTRAATLLLKAHTVNELTLRCAAHRSTKYHPLRQGNACAYFSVWYATYGIVVHLFTLNVEVCVIPTEVVNPGYHVHF